MRIIKTVGLILAFGLWLSSAKLKSAIYNSIERRRDYDIAD